MTNPPPVLADFGDVPPPPLAALLRSLVGPIPPTAAALDLIAAAAIGRADPGIQKLLPLASARLDLSALPATIRQALAARRRQAEIRAMVQDKVARMVGGDLAAHAIAPLFLKGFALAIDGYDQPWQRPMGDLDIAVRATDFSRAVERLRTQGFVPRGVGDLVPAQVGINTHALTLHHPVHHQTVDLHRHVLAASIWPGADDGFWHHARPFWPAGGTGLLTLAPEHHVVQACLHGYARSILQVSVRWIVDVCTILRRDPAAWRWDLVEAEAARHRCGPVLAASLAYAGDIAGLPLPAPVLRRLADTPAHPFDLAYFRLARDTVRQPSLANRVRLHWYRLQRQDGRHFATPLHFIPALRRHWGAPSWRAMARAAWALRRQSAAVTAKRTLWLDRAHQ